MITTEKKLDETDKKILKLFSEGLKGKEVADKTGISHYMVSARVRSMKKYYGCSNLSQLILKCKEEL